MSDPIRLLSAGLSETQGEIIAQGFLNVENLRRLLVDSYQREVLTTHSRKVTTKAHGIMAALIAGKRLPAIVLGMRGEDYEPAKDDMILNDKCYIIDGLQRTSNILAFVEQHPEKADDILIGAEVHFGTTRETEKDLFHALNSSRTPMSPNVILRNLRDKNRAVLTLYGLSQGDKDFPLYKKIQWNQRMARGELITAAVCLQVLATLHGRGRQESGRGHREPGTRIQAIADMVGLPVFRHNTKAFFETLDRAYNISAIQFVQKATPIKSSFLVVVAKFLADHDLYWEEDGSLNVPTAEIKRLSTFPIGDYEVMRLASAGSTAAPILYEMLKEHMNKRRHNSNKLKPRAHNPVNDKHYLVKSPGRGKNFHAKRQANGVAVDL